MGKSIVYDTVNGEQWKWSVNVQNHGINVLIDSVLDKNVSVPEAHTEDDCVVGSQTPRPSRFTRFIYLFRSGVLSVGVRRFSQQLSST
jgi:hypothetical protein